METVLVPRLAVITTRPSSPATATRSRARRSVPVARKEYGAVRSRLGPQRQRQPGRGEPPHGHGAHDAGRLPGGVHRDRDQRVAAHVPAPRLVRALVRRGEVLADHAGRRRGTAPWRARGRRSRPRGASSASFALSDAAAPGAVQASVGARSSNGPPGAASTVTFSHEGRSCPACREHGVDAAAADDGVGRAVARVDEVVVRGPPSSTSAPSPPVMIAAAAGDGRGGWRGRRR